MNNIIIIIGSMLAIIGFWDKLYEDGKITKLGVLIVIMIMIMAFYEIYKTNYTDIISQKQKLAEIHWSNLENQSIQKIRVYLFTQNTLPLQKMISCVKKIRIGITKKENDEITFNERLVFPQLTSDTSDDNNYIAWLWMKYRPMYGYWWKSSLHEWKNQEMPVAGVDIEIPVKKDSSEIIMNLHELSGIRNFGITIPWEVVELGIEEARLVFEMSTASIEYTFTQDDFQGLKWLLSQQKQVLSEESFLPLGICVLGQTALDRLRNNYIGREIGDETSQISRGFSGLEGPNGNKVEFFPNIPKIFLDSDEAKPFIFKIR